jgi:hypothetical protein
MTELGSQGYHPGFRMATLPSASRLWSDRATAWPDGVVDAHGQPRLLVFPAWCRVRAVDPDSLELLPEGHRGLLRFYDLSNVDSILAIQTADVGIVLPEGVLLEGRAKGSTPRGCSLAVDEILRGHSP